METQIASNLFKKIEDSVYVPSEDTFILIDAIIKDLQFIKAEVKPLICLEIGCGSGAVITTVAKTLGQKDCFYFTTDINEKALKSTQKLCSTNGITEGIQLVKTDLVSALGDRLKNSIDLLIFNPPFMPTSSGKVGHPIICSFAGGKNGREIIDRILPLTPSLLSPKGVFYMACIRTNNIPEIEDIMRGLGFQTTMILEHDYNIEKVFVLRFTKITIPEDYLVR